MTNYFFEVTGNTKCFLCACLCLRVCAPVCVFACLCKRVYVLVHVSTCAYMCMRVCQCACVRSSMLACVSVPVRLRVSVYALLCVCVNVHVARATCVSARLCTGPPCVGVCNANACVHTHRWA